MSSSHLSLNMMKTKSQEMTQKTYPTDVEFFRGTSSLQDPRSCTESSAGTVAAAVAGCSSPLHSLCQRPSSTTYWKTYI